MNIEALKRFAHLAQSEIANGALEDKLRHLFSSELKTIFPEEPWWIQDHVLGTETFVHFANESGTERTGFADTVVGKTAIEYEKNLNIQGIFEEGYHQVEEYCAALYNNGIKENEILGVLSDTVRWYGYSIVIDMDLTGGTMCGANNITLVQEDFVDLSLQTDEVMQKFELFVKKYMGRDQSRILNAKALVIDFGVGSKLYSSQIAKFVSLIDTAMETKPDYGELIKSVWQNFVAYLGASDYGAFSMETYVNEFYLVTVAKMICANVLNGTPLISSEDEIKRILDGKYFKQHNIMNLVDYDYFGWLNKEPFVNEIISAIQEIQNILCAYDYSIISEQDLFGELLAQLANKEHRLLLGQEFTPHWVAKEMVEATISDLNEYPKALDMCCGSGVFLIEVIKSVRKKYEIQPDFYNTEKDNIIFSCVMGFDIDPLAIMLAKVNWILSMKDLFSLHSGSITVPIYHADSLFVATPITHNMPSDEEESYALHFDDSEISIPAFILKPEHRSVFDSYMSKSYKLAMVRAEHQNTPLTDAQVNTLMEAVTIETGVELSATEKQIQRIAVYNLVLKLEQLQRAGRNGIWFFILSNSYRPGLTANQFNCIVSNPPWLAMSKLADNPYKGSLISRVNSYGIKPPGASHLHMELATTFLLCSIDKYLVEGGRWSCVLPGSVLSGVNHEPLRQEKYRTADHCIEAKVDEIWELPIPTFKNKAIVLTGNKSSCNNPEEIQGRQYIDDKQYQPCNYVLSRQGNRTAWTNHGSDFDIIDLINEEPMIFYEGADIFPRTALFHEYTRLENNLWKVDKIEQSSELYYLISERKISMGIDIEGTGFDDKYMFDCLTSKLLSPFYMSDSVKVIMPGYKENGSWKKIDDQEMAIMNAGTEFIFNSIESEVGMSLDRLLLEKINMRGKLFKQQFVSNKWLILSSAGGSNICAAYIPLEGVNCSKLIVDQTLYWYLVDSEDEAKYIVGLLNSPVLGNAIKDFQPQGGFGRRHIHTIPYKIMPRYDRENDAHNEVICKTSSLIHEWYEYCSQNEVGKYLQPNSSSLPSRRRKLQTELKQLPSFEAYSSACATVFGIE
ncbi:MAG: N-6 DNA methylase [Lachnospiraceae bacterium]|nr:N-6 DNA methylase [Anaerostipes sp.]MDD3617481.1 N-6 DNA methylase [Lachnospiraceae bacterium]